MNLTAFLRFLSGKKLRRTAPQKMLYATIDNAAPSVVQGASVDVLLTGRFVSFEGSVALAVNGLPSGVSGAFTPTALGAGVNTSTLRLTATGGASTVTNDAFTITLTPADTTVPAVTLNCTCTVTASVSPSITVSASPTSTSALQGETDTTTVTITRTAFTGDITLSASGLPTGASVVFAPNPLTGATLQSIATVTNTVGATPVTNDAWTIAADGSGVSQQTQAMTHTITSPNVTRGVPNYTGAIKHDLMAYANEAALDAVVTNSASKTVMLTKMYGMAADSRLLNRTSVSRAKTHNGHPVLDAYIVNSSAPNVAYSSPPYITSYFSNPGVQSVVAYVAVKFDAGWTTRGSATGAGIGQTYKLWALGFNGANGRVGIEYTGGSGFSMVGAPTSASIVLPSSYTNNLTSQTVNQAPGAYGAGAASGKPYSTDTLWAAGGTACFLIEVIRVSSTTMRQRFWTWEFGSEPTAGPMVDVSFTLVSGTLPTVDRINLGENFGQPLASRYAPDPCYHGWAEWGVWDYDTYPNPCGVN